MAIPGMTAAKGLLAHIFKDEIKSCQTIREIQQKDWTGLKKLEDIREGLKVLSEYHWVQVCRGRSGEKGGRPSEHVLINPEVRNG